MPHVLVVGGSGMLAGVCTALASSGNDVSVLARTRSRLEQLADRHDAIHPIPQDYQDVAGLRAAIHDATAARGPVDRCVAWIHSIAPDAPRVVANVIASARRPRFHHIVGSASADPVAAHPRTPEWLPGVDVSYQRIVLGFIVENGSSRWLTDDEICHGVLSALESEDDDATIGVVRPWDQRP